ncbi:unnamed protein product, partial [Polarella glacialis]
VGLVSFMLDANEPRTTGGVHTTAVKRREHAKASFSFNAGRAEFRELFPEFCDESRRARDGSFSITAEPNSANVGSFQEPAADGALQVPQADGEAPGPIRLPRALLALSIVVIFVSYFGFNIRDFRGAWPR